MKKRRGRILLAIVAYNVFLKARFRKKITELFHTLKDVIFSLVLPKAAPLALPPVVALSPRASQAMTKSRGTQTRNLRI